MAKILPFKRPPPDRKAQGKTLCRHDFHKWKIEKERRFDVRAGRLLTVYRCERCGKTKTSLT